MRLMISKSRETRPERATSPMILIFDFGSQYTQLIARKIRQLNVKSEIVPFDWPLDKVRAAKPEGIILSGGPASTYAPGAPKLRPALLELCAGAADSAGRGHPIRLAVGAAVVVIGEQRKLIAGHGFRLHIGPFGAESLMASTHTA